MRNVGLWPFVAAAQWALGIAVTMMAFVANGAFFGGGVLGFVGSLALIFFAPSLAAVVAIVAAVEVWEWPWWGAAVVFLWPLAFAIASSGASVIFATATSFLPAAATVKHSSGSQLARDEKAEVGDDELAHAVMSAAAEPSPPSTTRARGEPGAVGRFVRGAGLFLMGGGTALSIYLGVFEARESSKLKAQTQSAVEQRGPASLASECLKTAMTNVAMQDCNHIAISAADERINATYQRLIAIFKTIDANHENYNLEQSLRIAERAWIDYRDKNCRSIAAEYGSGSGGPFAFGDCRLDMTIQRERELMARLDEWARSYGHKSKGVSRSALRAE